MWTESVIDDSVAWDGMGRMSARGEGGTAESSDYVSWIWVGCAC